MNILLGEIIEAIVQPIIEVVCYGLGRLVRKTIGWPKDPNSWAVPLIGFVAFVTIVCGVAYVVFWT